MLGPAFHPIPYLRSIITGSTARLASVESRQSRLSELATLLGPSRGIVHDWITARYSSCPFRRFAFLFALSPFFFLLQILKKARILVPF